MGAYAIRPYRVMNNFYRKKNITHADGRVHIGAYTIRPYLDAINFYQ